jgi:hypothetical protein
MRDNVEQKEFEDLMVFEGIKTVFKEPFSHPLPVTNVEVVI